LSNKYTIEYFKQLNGGIFMNKANEIFEEDNKDPELQALKKALKENKNKRMHIRYMVIYHHLKGALNIDIASMENLCDHTVGIYINSYKQNGIQGLKMGKSTGAPRLLTLEQENQLVEVITTKTPDEVGFFPRKNWDSNIIRQWVLINFNIKYTQRGMLEVLYRLDLSYTRPTYTLAKADPQKQEEFIQEFELIKKTD
jgi:transposase